MKTIYQLYKNYIKYNNELYNLPYEPADFEENRQFIGFRKFLKFTYGKDWVKILTDNPHSFIFNVNKINRIGNWFRTDIITIALECFEQSENAEVFKEMLEKRLKDDFFRKSTLRILVNKWYPLLKNNR